MSIIKKILLVIVIIILLVVIIQIVNAAKYKMVLNVVEGENIMGINPLADKLDFGDLSRNNGMTRYVTMKSGGKTATYVMVWKWGSISDLVKLNKNNFVLQPGEEVQLAFELQVPPSAEFKKYSGWTWIFRLPKLF
jgi:hypothetical protein